MEMLRIYDADDLRSLPAGLWGIREPDRLRPDGMGLREDGAPAVSFYFRSCFIARSLFVSRRLHSDALGQRLQPWNQVSTWCLRQA